MRHGTGGLRAAHTRPIRGDAPRLVRRFGLQRAIVLSLALACPLSLAPCPLVGADELKIAYVNMVKIFDEYERTKKSDEVLERQGEQREAELEGRLRELKKLREKLELLNDDSREGKRRQVEAKADSLKRFRTNALRDLHGRREEMAEAIFDDIQQGVEEYAKAKGVTFVMDQRSILYGQPGYDATEEVIQLLNTRYRQRR